MFTRNSLSMTGSSFITLLGVSVLERVPVHRRLSRTLLLLNLVFAVSAGADTLEQRAKALREAETPAVTELSIFSGRLLAEFYAERDYRAAWDENRARALLDLASNSRSDGFEPADFHADAVERVIDIGQLHSTSEDGRAAAELLLSDALLRYLHHFRFGKHNPRHINPGSIFVDKADAEALKADMELVLAAPDMGAKLAAMLPNPPFYRNLKLGYRRYLDIAGRGTWQDLPGGANLVPGTNDSRVPLIRERLAVIDGYKPATAGDPERYDDDLVEAIKGFQRRSGLAQDGIVGPNTLRALNQPIGERLLTIRANLERMRWLYDDLPPDYLFVDVTAYRLHLLRDHEEVWSTPVVVGTVDAQTPMFRDEMEHIVFNPTWSVPVSIQKKMRGVSSRYQVVDRRTGRRVSRVNASNYKRYRIVQPAGPSNALGRVKFMFPNGHAIYLHDTPSKHLFSRSIRAYSHGCVRVKDPLTLARQVLDQPNWDRSEIDRVVRRGKTRYVHLDEHLPVLLYYLTAVADDQGRVGFRRDVYNWDKQLFAALDRPADIDRIAFSEPESPPEPKPEPNRGPVAELVSTSRSQTISAPISADDPDDQPEPGVTLADDRLGADGVAEPRDEPPVVDAAKQGRAAATPLAQSAELSERSGPRRSDSNAARPFASSLDFSQSLDAPPPPG